MAAFSFQTRTASFSPARAGAGCNADASSKMAMSPPPRRFMRVLGGRLEMFADALVTSFILCPHRKPACRLDLEISSRGVGLRHDRTPTGDEVIPIISENTGGRVAQVD